MDITTVASKPVSTPTPAISQGGGEPSRASQEVPAASIGPVSSSVANSTPPGTEKTASPDAIAKGLQQLNDSFSQNGVNLSASYEKDKITGIEVIQIKDKNTNEVIRQMPSKEMLAIAQSMELPQGWRGQLIYDKS
jgi:flagellar protein FlaG